MKNPTPTHQRAAGVPPSLSRPARTSGFVLALFVAALTGVVLKMKWMLLMKGSCR
jgi:hypothetical protein